MPGGLVQISSPHSKSPEGNYGQSRDLYLYYVSLLQPRAGAFAGQKYFFEQIDVSMSSDLRQAMRSRAAGRTSVPQIFIDDEHIGGCDELMALESAGHLDALLRGQS